MARSTGTFTRKVLEVNIFVLDLRIFGWRADEITLSFQTYIWRGMIHIYCIYIQLMNIHVLLINELFILFFVIAIELIFKILLMGSQYFNVIYKEVIYTPILFSHNPTTPPLYTDQL